MPTCLNGIVESPRRVMAVVGTRPEGIKTLPVVQSLMNHPHLDVITVDTGQHREILRRVFRIFDLEPDHRLDVMRLGQGLSSLFALVLEQIDPILQAERPDALIVQGDTTTAAAAALAAFHRQIPVVHLEAGLRTATVDNPFPEEANRRMVSRIAALHLAPTAQARENLEREAVDPASISVTGNTVIDALLSVSDRPLAEPDPVVEQIRSAPGPVLLVTAHRRESWGSPWWRSAEPWPGLSHCSPISRSCGPCTPTRWCARRSSRRLRAWIGS